MVVRWEWPVERPIPLQGCSTRPGGDVWRAGRTHGWHDDISEPAAQGITTGGQFAPDAQAESTLLLDPATRDIVLSPGESESFQELADGDVIGTLNVNRSDDGSGCWISPAKTVSLKPLNTDSDPSLQRGILGPQVEERMAPPSASLSVRDVG